MLPLLLAIATVQSDRLPPANPIPLADADTAAVMAPVNTLLAAIRARDSAAASTAVRADAPAIAATERPDGTRSVRRMSWAEFAANIKPGPERYDERLTDPAIEVDGDIAVVWSPYTFTIDAKLAHCGVNHFSLVREGGRWQIAALTWTQRTTGCPAT